MSSLWDQVMKQDDSFYDNADAPKEGLPDVDDVNYTTKEPLVMDRAQSKFKSFYDNLLKSRKA